MARLLALLCLALCACGGSGGGSGGSGGGGGGGGTPTPDWTLDAWEGGHNGTLDSRTSPYSTSTPWLGVVYDSDEDVHTVSTNAGPSGYETATWYEGIGWRAWWVEDASASYHSWHRLTLTETAGGIRATLELVDQGVSDDPETATPVVPAVYWIADFTLPSI